MIAMATTTGDVRDALSHLTSAEIETGSNLSRGVRVTIGEDDIGQFFKAIRQNDLDANTTRLGDTLVADIAAEEPEGLGKIFG